MRVILTELITPLIVLRLPGDIPVAVQQCQRQAPVVAVIQVFFSQAYIPAPVIPPFSPPSGRSLPAIDGSPCCLPVTVFTSASFVPLYPSALHPIHLSNAWVWGVDELTDAIFLCHSINRGRLRISDRRDRCPYQSNVSACRLNPYLPTY